MRAKKRVAVQELRKGFLHRGRFVGSGYWTKRFNILWSSSPEVLPTIKRKGLSALICRLF